jgi:hypothetical protein
MLFAGIVLLLFQFIYDKKSLYIKQKDFLYIFITCLFHMYINFLSETYALQKISSVMVSLFYLLSPIISAIIDYVLTKNKLSKEQIIIVFIGTALSIFMIFLNTDEIYSFNNTFFPYILLLVSIITSTLAWYRIKFILNRGYSLVVINGYASLLSGVIFFCMNQYINGTILLVSNINFTYIIF